MHTILIGLHAGMGEIGALAFLWVFVELLNPDARRVFRAQVASTIGIVSLVLSWLVGGFYYVTYYGVNVKPVIKEGPLPWAHLVITETKEHIFLFLPFLALLVFGFIYAHREELSRGKRMRSILIISLLVFLLSMAMAGMGYLISSGFRSAIEQTL